MCVCVLTQELNQLKADSAISPLFLFLLCISESHVLFSAMSFYMSVYVF